MNSFFDDYFSEIKYKDDFGYNPTWNSEINKWLSFLYELDKRSYIASKKRVVIDKQRDEFLAEIIGIYYFGNLKQLRVTQIEPPGKGNKLLDFAFVDKENNSWFVEVKRPSWRGEIIKDTSISFEQKLKRLKKPQFINAEARSFSEKDALEEPIKNALPKFLPNSNNLLIILPDMFAQIGWLPYIEESVKEEVRGQDSNDLISTILILENILPLGKSVQYLTKFIEITKLPVFDRSSILT